MDGEDFSRDDEVSVHHVLREASDGDISDGVFDEHGLVWNGLGFTAFGVRVGVVVYEGGSWCRRGRRNGAEEEGVGRRGVRHVGRGSGGSHGEVVENVAGGVSKGKLSSGEGHANVAGELGNVLSNGRGFYTEEMPMVAAA